MNNDNIIIGCLEYPPWKDGGLLDIVNGISEICSLPGDTEIRAGMVDYVTGKAVPTKRTNIKKFVESPSSYQTELQNHDVSNIEIVFPIKAITARLSLDEETWAKFYFRIYNPFHPNRQGTAPDDFICLYVLFCKDKLDRLKLDRLKTLFGGNVMFSKSMPWYDPSKLLCATSLLTNDIGQVPQNKATVIQRAVSAKWNYCY